MKRLLIVTNQPSPYRVDFFRFLQEDHSDKYDIHILFSTDNKSSNRSWSTDESRLKNVHFLKSKVIKFHSNFDDTQTVIPYGTEKILDGISPDAVVCAEYNGTALTTKHWCNIHKVPYISWSDGTRYSERNIHFYQKLFRKYIIKDSAAFIASSSKTRENQIFLGAPEDRIYVSLLTVDIDKYEGCGEKYDPAGPMLYVGSLTERKGLDLLFNALMLNKDCDWQLEIVGNGPEQTSLEDMAARLGISDRIHFRGFLSGEDLTAEYEKSSIFILPTREDCFGLVMIEAMCCGLPVISSRYADGAYDLVKTGINGCIADPYDEETFAKVIRKIISDDEMKMRMSVQSRMAVRKFRFENTAVGFMEAVKCVLR